MAMNQSKLLSGRVPLTPYNNLSNSRYEFLGLSDAEPSLGVPTTTGSLFTSTSNGIRSWSNVINIGSNTVTFYGQYSFPNTSGNVGQVLSSDGNGNIVFTTLNTTELVNGNSNVSVAANGNVSVSVAGTSNVLVIGSTSTALKGNLTVNGNVSNVNQLSATTINANSANIDGNLTVTGNISNANIISANSLGLQGNLTVAGNISNANVINANYLISSLGCVKIAQGVIAVDGNNAGIFASLVDDVNIGLEANVILGSTSGNVTARGTFNAANIVSTGTITAQNIRVGDLYSNRAPVNVYTDTIIDSFGINEYRSAKYTIRASNDLGYQALEVLLVHDNINSITTIYGSLSTTGSDIIVLTSDINTGIVELRATGLSANTRVNLLGTYVPD